MAKELKPPGKDNLTEWRLRNGRPLRYLVFEGGGGKGNVYIGAIQAFQDAGILTHESGSTRLDNTIIKGVAGTSAGAITAFLVSCGTLARLPVDGSKDITTIDQEMGEAIDKYLLDTSDIKDPKAGMVVGIYDKNLKQVKGGYDPTLNSGCTGVTYTTKPGRNYALIIKKVLSYLRLSRSASVTVETATDSLQKCWGVLSGAKIRHPLSQYLMRRIVKVAKSGRLDDSISKSLFDKKHGSFYNITFEQHCKIFGIELAVAGFNLVSNKSLIFSPRSTPNFPVVDAVRISMGLPFLYRPVIITKEQASSFGNVKLEGVWIDGGTVCNLPITAFGYENTIGIRLTVDQPGKIRNFDDFLGRFPLEFIKGSPGESYVDDPLWAANMIVLDTGNLGLLEFHPKSDKVKPLIEEARILVKKYCERLRTQTSSNEPEMFPVK